MTEAHVRSAETILTEAVDSFRNVVALSGLAEQAAAMVVDALRAGGKVFFCGNGGSAADAQHLAAEFLGRYLVERPSLAALALTSNSSAVTAIGNDYGYEHVFSRQLLGLGRAGDVLFGISTSGNSRNVVLAFEAARRIGVATIAFTGAKDSAMSQAADLVIRAPSLLTPRIQEMHIALGHTICELVETRMLESGAV
jgi:D-sedoheptulose 7-phosphate isomerase